MKLIRYTEKPELWANTAEISHEVRPEYNQHGDVMNAYWGRLFEEFPPTSSCSARTRSWAKGTRFPAAGTALPVAWAEGSTR